jgi:site-specific DNA recombinase
MARTRNSLGPAAKAGALTTALIYTRVSTDEQAREGVSLAAQLDACRRYAATRGWILGTEYQDVQSGKRDDRPQYQALLADIRRRRGRGEACAVVVLRLDRLGRRLLERVRAWEEMKALGGAIHSVNEGGAVPELVANVLASVAQEESRQTGERIAAVKQHLMGAGWSHGGRIPWGYRSRATTEAERREGAPGRILELDPETAPYVRQVFERIAASESVRSVTRWIATLPAVARGGRQLPYGSIQGTVRAPVYMARVTPDGPVGRWPAIVDEATWWKAQEQLAQHATLPRQASARHLLTGLARCPRCGQRLQGCERRGRPLRDGTPRRMYVCGIGQANGQCSYSISPATALDSAVLTAVGQLINALTLTACDSTIRRKLEQQWRRLQNPPERSSTDQQRRDLEQIKERALERLRHAATLFTDRELDRAGYELVREAEQASLDAATAALAALAPTPAPVVWPSLDSVLGQLGDWGRLLQAGDLASVRTVLAQLISQLTPRRPVPEIVWTPLGAALLELAATLTPREGQRLAG